MGAWSEYPCVCVCVCVCVCLSPYVLRSNACLRFSGSISLAHHTLTYTHTLSLSFSFSLSLSVSHRYSLATGNWGTTRVAGAASKTGVSQVLNRLSFASTLSHLRRLNTPLGRDGKLARPRQVCERERSRCSSKRDGKKKPEQELEQKGGGCVFVFVRVGTWYRWCDGVWC